MTARSGGVTLRNLAYLASVGAVCATALIEYLNFTGFCYGQGRYLGEQELVNFAIEQAIHFSDLVTTDVRGRQVYSSVEEFEGSIQNAALTMGAPRSGRRHLGPSFWLVHFGR